MKENSKLGQRITLLTNKTFKNAEKRLKRVLTRYFGRKDQLALMNWSLNIELMAKRETEHQLAESGQALQQLGSMLDQQECRVRELEVDLDKEKVKKRKAEKNAQEAEDELQVLSYTLALPMTMPMSRDNSWCTCASRWCSHGPVSRVTMRCSSWFGSSRRKFEI